MTGAATSSIPVISVGAAGWKLHAHELADSTNNLARPLPAWSAVVARRQSTGRGRFGRAFACAEGGLWLSAVVPAEPPASRWAGFSLAVGLHLLIALERLGVPGVRLRWPNDLMVADRKLGGILVEQGTATTLVVGFGLNVSNRPWEQDPSLEKTALNMIGLLPSMTSPDHCLAPSLDAIADAHEDILSRGLAAIITDLNSRWQPRRIELTLHSGEKIAATFEGLDPHGNLSVDSASGRRAVIPHNQIERLTELPD